MYRRIAIVMTALAGIFLCQCTVMKRKISEQIANELVEAGDSSASERGFSGKAYLASWNADLVQETNRYHSYCTVTLEFLDDKTVNLKVEATMTLGDDETSKTFEEIYKYKTSGSKLLLSPGPNAWTFDTREGSFLSPAEPLTKFLAKNGYKCENYTDALIFSEI